VFPRLHDDPRHGRLVATIEQLEKGHAVTTEIWRLSQSKDAPALTRKLRSFSRMYGAPAARKDSALFLAFEHRMQSEQRQARSLYAYLVL
jgi:hypothetical protein